MKKMKKFAIGLSPLEYYDNDLEAFKNFCKKNDYRIEHWYCGLPWTWWTKKIKYSSYREQKKNFKKQLQIIAAENQKFQLCVNIDLKSKFLTLLFSLSVLWYKWFYTRYKSVDSIVCRDEYIPYLRRIFPGVPLTYSTQNDFKETKFKNLKYCTTIVIGRKYLKSLYFIEKMKKEYGLKIELLLNCACNFACSYNCFDGSCESSQNTLIAKKGINWCVAWQSLIPSELALYPEGLIDFYKLSTRPSSLSWMESEMDLYSSEKTLSELSFRYDRPQFWRLICCTNSICNAVTQEVPDINEVLNKKSQIWSWLLKRQVRVW